MAPMIFKCDCSYGETSKDGTFKRLIKPTAIRETLDVEIGEVYLKITGTTVFHLTVAAFTIRLSFSRFEYLIY